MLTTLVLAAALSASSTDSNRSLRAVVQDYFRARDHEDPSNPSRYTMALVDMNGDGRNEAFVYVSGDGMCGTGGCRLLLYTPHGRTWRKVQSWVVVWPPIRLLRNRSQGWQSFSVFVAGGGIIPGYNAEMRFDGRAYPSNPSMAPARRTRGGMRGRTLISRSNVGRPLY